METTRGDDYKPRGMYESRGDLSTHKTADEAHDAEVAAMREHCKGEYNWGCGKPDDATVDGWDEATLRKKFRDAVEPEFIMMPRCELEVERRARTATPEPADA